MLTNFLGLAGAALVVVLLCATALGKWEKGIAFRCMIWFAVVGIAIPTVFLSAKLEMSDFFLALWPSSIGLMGLNGTGSTASELSAVGMLILINAGLYGIMGLVVGYAWQGILRFHKDRK